MTRHAAIVEFSTKLILEMLDFKGGKLHRIYTPDDWLIPETFCVVVEHPDLPKVEKGMPLQKITPMLAVDYGDNGIPLRIYRTDPPKRNELEN